MDEFFATRAEAVAHIGNHASKVMSNWEAILCCEKWANLVTPLTVRPETEWEATVFVVNRVELGRAMEAHLRAQLAK